MPKHQKFIELGLMDPDQEGRTDPLTNEQLILKFLELGGVEAPDPSPRSTEGADADTLSQNPLFRTISQHATTDDRSALREFIGDMGRMSERLPEGPHQIAASAAGTWLRGLRGTDEILDNQITKLEGLEERFSETPIANFATKSMRQVSEHIVSSLQNARERLITGIEEVAPRSIVYDTAIAGTVEGLTFGWENLPAVGGVIDVFTTPIKQNLEREAQDTMREVAMTMETSAGEALFATVPGMVGGLGGTLTGGYASFLPFMRLGRWAMAVPGALRSMRDGNNFLQALKAHRAVFVGDVAGSFAFGALADEKGPLTHLLGAGMRNQGILEDVGELDESASWRDRALHSAWSRMRSGLSMGAEGFAFSAILRNTAIGSFTDVPASRKAWIESFNKWMRGRSGSALDYATLRQAHLLTEPGMRKFLKINDPEDARILVDMRAQDEIIQNSPAAMRVLSEQAAVEGVVSYQSSVAALAAGVYDLGVKGTGSMGVLYNIPDPYRLMQDVSRRGSRLDDALNKLPVKQAPKPLVHEPREVTGDVLLGYISRAGGDQPLTQAARSVDPDMPIFLQHRPNLAASERGLVEEVLVNPARTKSFRDWGALIDEHGDINRAWRTLRKGNDTVVIERGAGGDPTVVVLNPEQIKSAKHVTPETINARPQPQTSGEAMAREFANEPLEVALQKILPDFQFSAPVRNADGTYNLVMWKRGSPGPSGQQLKQLKEEGFFVGQRVMYGSSQAWEVSKVRAKTLDITDPVSGETSTVTRRKVQALPVAQFGADMPVDDAMYRQFVDYMNRQIDRVAALRPGAVRLREMARASQNPAHLERDMVTNNVDFIAYPSEVMFAQAGQGNIRARMAQTMQEIQNTQKTPENSARLQELIEEVAFMQDRLRGLGRRAQNEQRLLNDVDLDEATVMVPDELDYFRLGFKNFLKENNIDLRGGEFETMQLNFMRRFARDTWNKLPAGERRRLNKLRNEIIEGIESLPNDIETKAKLAGYNLGQFRQDGGYFLHRPGHEYIEGVYMTEQGVEAALDRALRYGTGANLTPQTDWFPFAMPQAGPAGSLPGQTPLDMLIGRRGESLNEKAIDLMARRMESDVPVEWSKGKPRWALLMEEQTDIPVYSEFLSPLFQGWNQANNAKIPAMDQYMRAFRGLNPEQRREIGRFVLSVEDQTKFIEKGALLEAAKDFGLSASQRRALAGMRDVMDDHFRLGMDWYGWEPTDYIYNFFHHMLPLHERGVGRAGAAMYGDNLPHKFNIFSSKYERLGMLPFKEDDPLIVGLKYLNTFYHERFIAPHWDKLRELTKMKFGQLPPTVQEAVKSRMPRHMAAKVDANSPALPANVAGPLNEVLEHMVGYPSEVNRFGTQMVKGIFNRLGVPLNDKQVGQVFDQGLLLHYGAALGFRPIPVVRNTIQNLITNYTRFGSAAVGQGFARANDAQFFARAVEEGIVPLSSRGVHFADARIDRMLDEFPIDTRGLRGAVTGGMLKSFAHDGLPAKGIRKMADVGLSGIQNTDHYNRIVAAATQDAHIRPLVQQFINGKMDKDQLVKRGLRYWEKPIQDKFLNILENQGSEKAIWYLNRENATATQFIYGSGAQPGWLQSPTGRTFYAYGTFSLWYKDFLFRTMNSAPTWTDRAKFIGRMMAINAAITGVGLEFGVDMKNWLGSTAVSNYGGGPGVDRVMNVIEFTRASDAPTKMAVVNNAMQRGVFANFFPGQLFLRDVQGALQAEPWPLRGLAAFTLGRPTDDMESWHLDLIDMLDSTAKPVTDRTLAEEQQEEAGGEDQLTDMLNQMFQNAPGQTPDGPEGAAMPGAPPAMP